MARLIAQWFSAQSRMIGCGSWIRQEQNQRRVGGRCKCFRGDEKNGVVRLFTTMEIGSESPDDAKVGLEKGNRWSRRWNC